MEDLASGKLTLNIAIQVVDLPRNDMVTVQFTMWV
jgi:hypothetical protein